MPKSHRLTAWDALQLLTKLFSDQQVRMVVELDGRLDVARLADAIRAVFAAEPILGFHIQERFFRPRWKPLARLDAASVLRIVPAADPEAEIRKLVLEDLDPLRGPIVRFSVVRGERDAVVVNLDHTAGDAASVRGLAYLLAAAYGKPERIEPAEPAEYFGRREFTALEPLMPSMKGKKLRDNPMPAQPPWQFPWGGEPNAGANIRKRLCLRRVEAARAGAIRKFAADRGAWLNDVFLAAYFRALARLLAETAGGGEHGAPRFTVPADLRSYLAARERPRIANFSSTFEAAPEGGLGGSFDETLARVRASTEKAKNGKPGLGSAAFMSAMVDRYPFRLIERRMDWGKIRSTVLPPWFIALGVLRPESLAFGPVAARAAYSLQSFGRAGNVFQLSASTFAETMTFAVCAVCDDAQEAAIRRLLDLYESELPS